MRQFKNNIFLPFAMWLLGLIYIASENHLFVSAGQIDIQDYKMDYLNIGYTTQFKFTFSLQNGLGAKNYLQLTFPFPLWVTSLSTVEVKYTDASTTGCSTPTYLPATIIAGSSSYIYYITFQDVNLNPVALLPSPEWYTLQIKLERGFNTGLTAGILAPIQATTLSTNQANRGNPIYYDSNPSFAVLQFTTAPPTTLNVVPIIPSPQKYQIAYQYVVSFQIQPTIAIADYARIVIIMKQPKYFTFTGSCVSELQTVASGTIPPLDPSVYSCTIDTVNNRIVIELFTGLKNNLSYRFGTNVINPNHVIPTAGFEVRTMMGFSNQIVEQADLSQAIYTSYLTWGSMNASYKVYLGSMIDLSDSSFVNKAGVVTQQGFYNPYKFQFQTSLDIPDNTQLKLSIQINLGQFDVILTGSIRYNLPRYNANVPVSCAQDLPSQPTKIVCTGIGKMLATGIYYVTASIMFGLTTPISSTFGTATLTSMDLVNNVQFTMIQATPANILSHFLTPTANLDRIDYSTDQYGFQMIHSQPAYDASNNKIALQALSNTNYGLKMCGTTKQKLVVAFKKGANNEFGVNMNFAMRLVTSTNILASGGTTYVESLNAGCTVASEFNTQATMRVNTYSSFTEILFNPQTTANCIQSQTLTSVFSIGDITVVGHSSSYAADQSSIVFYGALYDSFVDGRAPTRYFAVNAHTISQGSSCSSKDLQGITVTLSNYYTSSGTQSGKSDGSQFPAFIRVTGFLTNTEKAGAQRIAVFFNNVDFFTESTDAYGRSIASCSSSINQSQQCWGYNGQGDQSSSIHDMKRVEFDVSTTIAAVTSTTPFQLLIPVSVVALNPTVRLFVSVMTNFASDTTLSATFINSYTFSQYTVFTGTNVAPETSSALLSYRLDSTSKVEGAKSLADLYIGHNGSVQTVARNTNTAPLLTGSAFTIVGDWQMYSNTLSVSVSNSLVNTALSSELCLGFRYFYQSTRFRYGIYCPFTTITASDPTISVSSKVTFSDFVYPALGPSKLSGTYITWSQNTGNIVSSLSDPIPTDASSQLLPNQITNVQPLSVKRFTKDNRVVWYFTTTNPIPKDGQVQSNSWLFSVSESGDANCFLMYATDSYENPTLKQCTVTAPTANNILFTLSYSQDFPAGNFQLIQYGFDASVNSITVAYTITVSTLTSTGGLIDQQASLPVVSLTFDNSDSWNTVIDILSYQYSHTQVEGSYGTFDMQFKINSRPILALSSPGYGFQSGQYLQINVASLVGQEASINCYLMQNSLIYFGFSNIYMLSATAIEVYPRDNILDSSSTFTFHCENVLNAYKNIMQYQVKLLYRVAYEVIKGGTSPSGASNPAYNKPPDFTNCILSKYNSLAGAHTQFKFTMSLNVQQINQNAAIFVTFPQKYSPRVGSNTLACKVNNQDVYCANLNSDRKIVISAFPTTIPVGQTFSLDIYGIISPSKLANNGNIQVMVASSIDPSTITEKNLQLDQSTVQDTTNALQINYATQANPNARESGSYSYKITASNLISSNQNVQIEFPSEYGTVISINPPTTCTITSVDGATSYGSGCIIFGLRIIIQVTTQIAANTQFLITIAPIQNPEQSTCTVTKVMISVLSQDLKQNNMASTVGSTNQPHIKFTYSSTLRYLNWFMNGVQIIYNTNTIQLVPGVYSSTISLVDPTGSFTKTLQYQLVSTSSATFSLISDKYIYPGQTSENLKIGCPSNTLPGQFTLSFTKSETGTQVYGNLGLMNVKVSNTQVQIAPAYTTYKVSVLGQSLPVYFDLSNTIPYSDVSVLFELQIMGLDPKIDLLNDDSQPVTQYTINFTPNSYKGKLQVRSSKMISPVYPDHKVKLKMTIFGTDAASYIQSTQDIIFQLYDVGQPTPPTLTYSPVLQTSDVLQNQITLIVNVNVPSAIYYHVRFQTGPTRTFGEVMQQVNKYTKLNPMDIFQEQFGILNAENTSQSFVISNLKQSKNYMISTWAYDELQRQSSLNTNSFTTKSNGGKLLKINIKFANIVSDAQKLTLSCYLCQQLAIPCINVMSYDSIFCASQSQYQLSIVDSVNLNSRRMLINEARARNLDTITSANTVQFYTLPLDDISSDSSYSTITPIIQNAQFALKLNANDPTLPQILSVASPTEVLPQTAPQLINTPSVSTGLNWFQVSKIETQSNSLIWMYLIDAPNGGTPSAQQMKLKLSNRNQTVSTFKIFYFDSTTDVTYNYTGLSSDTQYSLYLVATTENPSLFASTSDVSQIGKKTLSPQVVVVIDGRILSFIGTLFFLIVTLFY